MTRNEADPAPAEDRYRAPALDRGLDILEVLSCETEGLTRAEISQALGVSASQIYRVLERLVARGYVCRVGGGDRYALTMRLFLLATEHPPLRRLVAQAQPLMDTFAREMGQSCHLVLPDRDAAVVVAQASPVAHWEFRARVGARMDLRTTGSGLVLTAFGALTAANRADEGDLMAIRTDGHRVAASAQVLGVTDISVPVSGPAGIAIAALTCPFVRSPAGPSENAHHRALARLRTIAGALSMAPAG